MSKKKELSPELKAECDAAKSLFISKKSALNLTQQKLADMADISPAAVAQYLNGTNPLNARFAAIFSRAIGEPVERFSKRLAGELAQLAPVKQSRSSAEVVQQMLERHGKGMPAEARERIAAAVRETQSVLPDNVVVGDFSKPGPVGDEIRIPHYDIRAALGEGQLVPDFPEMLPDLPVSQKHLRELGITYKHPSDLKMFTGWGQSMEPTIRHLDPLIADASVREFQGDGIYAFIWQGHFYVKRLQISDADHFDMISDNPQHKDRIIRIDETYIQARIVLVWNAKRV